MHYYHQLNHAQRRKFVRRLRLFILAVVLIVCASSALIYIDNRRARNSNNEETTTTEVTTTTFAPSVQIFRTAYFQFQASSSWSQAVPESTNDKFVYRSKRGAIIDHELVVYVNRAPEARPVNRVLPVTLKREAELTPTGVSEHCGKKVKAIDQPSVPAVLDQVSFICTPNEPGYNVLVGLVGGGTTLTLPRPDGTVASYVIFYSNVTANPDALQLQEIANTFQAR